MVSNRLKERIRGVTERMGLDILKGGKKQNARRRGVTWRTVCIWINMLCV